MNKFQNLTLTPPQYALAVLMIDISERHWAAGWLANLEFDLWRRIQPDADRKYAGHPLSDGDVATLHWLSAQCGGWIVWDEEREEVFMPLSEWQERYDAWVKGIART